MPTLTLYCQNTDKSREVKETVLKAIAKDLQKCDSLKIAYEKQRQLIVELVDNNLTMFTEVAQSRKKEEQADLLIGAMNKKARKQARRQKNSKFWVVSAGVLGLIGGIILTK